MKTLFKITLAIAINLALFTTASAGLKQPSDCQMFDGVAPAEESKTLITNPAKNENRFNEIIDQVSSLYADQFRKLGVNFTIEKAWKDSTLNAYAQKKDSTNWMVHFYGGLFRNSAITEDGFALVVCHEIGHLLGGAPFYYGSNNSTEGQADFWATSVCMKRYSAEFKQKVNLENTRAKLRCDEHYSDNEDQNTCYRSALAGESLAIFFSRNATISSKPNFDKNNSNKLNYTYDRHPEAQCRLDTYVAGSICDRDTLDGSEEKLLNDKLITDSLCNETVDGALTRVEKRPGCWFNDKAHTFVENYKTRVKSKSIFGLKNGLIQVTYLNHIPGIYRTTLTIDAEDSEYLKLKQDTFTNFMNVNSVFVTYDFNYSFAKKANRPIHFTLKIYLNESLLIEDKLVINAYSLL